jgi:outer membrane protein assembly factor BamB
VWRLADSADHFTQVFTGLEGMGLVVAGPSGNVLLAGSEVAHSADEGVTWRNTGFTTSGPIRALAMAPDGHVFVGTESGGIYRASTADYAWNQLVTNFAPEQPYAEVNALMIKPDGTIFVGVNAAGPGLVFRSRDGGNTWTRIDLMVPLRP